MTRMFSGAKSFNQDLSEWNVDKVTNMAMMFNGATSFKQVLRGDKWVNSKANKGSMFNDSPGTIYDPFQPSNKEELTTAVSNDSPGDKSEPFQPSVSNDSPGDTSEPFQPSDKEELTTAVSSCIIS